jgi:hypothetical protein
VTGGSSAADPYVVSYAGDPSAKRVIASGYAQGSTQFTVLATAPATDIGVSTTLTLASPAKLIINAQVIGVAANSGQTTQGVGLLLLNNAIIQSKYYSTPTGSTLLNLPTPAVLTAVVNVPAGTHTLKLQADVWANTCIFNLVPTTYTGYTSAYDKCMASELSFVAYEV